MTNATDLALSISDRSINNAEKGAVAFTASGIDGDATGATVTFSDGVHSVTVDASAGVADLSGFNDGPVSSVLIVTDGAAPPVLQLGSTGEAVIALQNALLDVRRCRFGDRSRPRRRKFRAAHRSRGQSLPVPAWIAR